MSLSIGSLVGYLDLDDAAFDAGLDSATGKLRAFGPAGVAIAGAAGVAIGAAVVAGLSAMDAEAATDKLSAQLALTAPESARVGKVAGDLYAGAYGDSLDQVNDAVGAVMSSIKGMSTASSSDLQAMTAKVLDLSAAFGIDVARASQVAGQMIRSGMARDGAHALDLLTVSLQKVPTAVREDLVDALDEYSPFMAALGIKGEQAMGLLVKASEKGAFGLDKTGDALKEFTIRSADLTAASKVGYDALGMSQAGMTKKLLQGGPTAAKAFDQIVAGLTRIKDPAKQSQAALALFGTPLEDLSVAEIPAFLSSLQGAKTALGQVDGAAAKMGTTLADNASTNIESFKRQAQQAFVSILGGEVLPVISSAASALSTGFGPALALVGATLQSPVIPALQAFGAFLLANQTPILVIGGIIAAVLLPHLIALGVQAVIAAVRTAGAWMLMNAGAIAAAVWHSATVVRMVAGWVLMGGQALLQAGRMAAAWFIALGPIGWAIAAIVAVALIVWRNWDTIKKATGAAWSWVTAKVSAAASWLVGMFLRWTLVGIIISHWSQIRSSTTSAWSAVTAFVSSIPGRIVGFFTRWTLVGVIVSHWSRIRSGVAGQAGSLLSYVAGIPGRILGALGHLGSLLYSAGADMIRGAINGVQSMAGSIASTVLHTLTAPIDAAKAKLGIHSPSTVFADEIGRWLPAGVIAGIESGQGDLDRAVAGMVRVQGGSLDSASPSTRAAAVAGAGGRGPVVHIEHMVAADPAEAARLITREQRDAIALYGLTAMGV